MTNKKYYYIKLKDSYFEQDNIKVLESMPNGYVYSLIIIKLYLKAASHNGQLMMTSKIPYDPSNIDILASVIQHDVDHIKEAIKMAVKIDLITIIDGKELWMNDIQNMIGKSSTEADRIRAYRKQLGDGVQMYDKCTPEIEIEIDIEKEIEIDTKAEKTQLIDRILTDLNDICGTKFSLKTKPSRALVSARLDEGYSYDDFITVIKKKNEEWKNTDMQQYIRPQTLFSAKHFDEYLNSKAVVKKTTNSSHAVQSQENFPQKGEVEW